MLETVFRKMFTTLKINQETNLGNFIKKNVKPMQACTGLRGSRNLRLPDFKTTGT
jgi:hypothetical protein